MRFKLKLTALSKLEHSFFSVFEKKEQSPTFFDYPDDEERKQEFVKLGKEDDEDDGFEII